MAKITDRQAKALKPGDKSIPSGVTGLFLQPGTKPGRGRWLFRFVSPVTGKRRDMSMGSYPDVTVAAALAAGQAAREKLVQGQDPIEARAALKAYPTFEEAARIRWEEVKPGFSNQRHIDEWISSLERHIFPHIGRMRVDQLEPKHFADALRPTWLTIPETGRRLRQRCREVMGWSWAHGYRQNNPLDVVDHLLATQPPKKGRQPAMPWELVSKFVHEHLSKPPIIGSRAALLFLILTAARSGEVRGATWDEIDFGNALWTIPAERMKAGEAHRVPLSAPALELIRHQRIYGLHDEIIFPGVRGGMLSDMALTVILRDVKAPSDVAGRVATAHGFRSSFRNWAADNGFDRETAERALAHTIANKVQAAYERTDRLQARRDMMQQWADEVMHQTFLDKTTTAPDGIRQSGSQDAPTP